jgi:acetylornithine/succinyldiaminopimelate/putrescine aminotransferase
MLGVELVDGIDARGLQRPARAGLIVNAVNPTTLRLVPPITVTDDEIDEAVAMITASIALGDAGDRRAGGRHVTRHLLDVTDCHPDESARS